MNVNNPSTAPIASAKLQTGISPLYRLVSLATFTADHSVKAFHFPISNKIIIRPKGQLTMVINRRRLFHIPSPPPIDNHLKIEIGASTAVTNPLKNSLALVPEDCALQLSITTLSVIAVVPVSVGMTLCSMLF